MVHSTMESHSLASKGRVSDHVEAEQYPVRCTDRNVSSNHRNQSTVVVKQARLAGHCRSPVAKGTRREKSLYPVYNIRS